MKLLIASVVLFFRMAQADSLASIYNGTQFDLNGVMVAQDSDKSTDFYVLPSVFELDSGRHYDRRLKKFVDSPGFTHEIERDANGVKFSVYTFKFRMADPSNLELMSANQRLRLNRDFRNAEIKGLAPICGVDLKVPGFDSAERLSVSDLNPMATLVQYSMRSSSVCQSTGVNLRELTVLYRVPLAQEPRIAKSLMSEEGLFLPNVEVLHPYKYKDKVTLEVDAEFTVDQLKSSAGVVGQVDQVVMQVNGTIQKLMQKLEVSGGIHLDCQNPDKTVCNSFLDQAKDLMEKTLLVYTPIASQGDTNPLIIADSEKQASKVRVDLAFDQQAAKRIGKFRFDFNNSVYDSVRSQVRFSAARVNPEFFHPEIRAMLGH